MPDPTDSGADYTPDFMTPNQIAANRAYAKLLLENSTSAPTGSSGNVTAVSPFGVGAGLANSLAGRMLMNQAGSQEQQLIGNAASSIGSRVPPGAQQAASYSPQGGPQNVQASSYAPVTAQQEGNGNYSQVGPTTSDGDHAYGKYQVKGSNIPQWTQEALGQPLTPQQFLANPQAQDAVYQKKFSQYVQQYGPEGAARAWYGGPGNVNNPNARDLANPNAPTVGQYGQNFTKLASNAPGLPQPDTAPTGQNPSQGMALALRGPGAPATASPGAPSMGLPGVAPLPQTAQAGQPPIQAGMVPQRQMVSKEQLMKMTNPYIDPGVKGYIQQSYFGQYQPQVMKGAFDSNVLIDAQGHQQILPGVGQWGTSKVGPIEHQQYNAIIPPGYQGPAPSIFTGNPGSGGGGGQPALPPPTGAPGIKPPDLIPPKGNEAAPGKQGAVQGKLPQLASNETGVESDAPVPGLLGTMPPTTGAPGAGQTVIPKEAPPSAAPGLQTAQNIAPSANLDQMSDAEKYNWLQQTEVNKEKQTAFNQQDAKNYFDDLKSTQDFGTNAQNLDTELNIAENLVKDPRFIQGPWADPRLAVNTGLAALGSQDAMASQTLANTFEKLKSGNILDLMRAKLQGLGQVRLAEINLLSQASASKNNTMGANLAVLDINRRVAQQARTLTQIANMYDQGVRWDGNGHPLVDADGNAILHPQDRSLAGLNGSINTYLSNNKLFTPEEIKQYSKTLTDDNKPAEKPRLNIQGQGFEKKPAAQ